MKQDRGAVLDDLEYLKVLSRSILTEDVRNLRTWMSICTDSKNSMGANTHNTNFEILWVPNAYF